MKHLIVGGLYRHYKGNSYRVLHVARHSETEEPLVVYRALYGSYGVWARPLGMFLGTVEAGGENVPRFAYTGGNAPCQWQVVCDNLLASRFPAGYEGLHLAVIARLPQQSLLADVAPGSSAAPMFSWRSAGVPPALVLAALAIAVVEKSSQSCSITVLGGQGSSPTPLWQERLPAFMLAHGVAVGYEVDGAEHVQVRLCADVLEKNL